MLILAFLSALFVPKARAIVLDWDTVTWAPGSLHNSYDIDPDNAGNDVILDVVANNGAPLQPERPAPNPLTPALSPSFQGGNATIENSLCIALDLANNTQSVTLTVNFAAYAQGVKDVSFTIFDVDSNNVPGSSTYQDRISSIRALSIDGVTLIAPTITTSLNNSVSGTGVDQIVDGIATTADTGAGSGDGNVTISFGSAAIKSFTFTYGGGPLFDDSTYEHIGVSDISFTPIPEVNPASFSSASCLLAVGFVSLHRRRVRRSDRS